MIDTIEKVCKKQLSPSTKRGINPMSIPVGNTTIVSLDLDVTIDCNLDCDYCFKEKYKKQMPLEIAKQAIVWLIMASGDAKNLNVALIGGEPMLRFQMIKRLVPFAKRRSRQHGKSIHFSMTTNGTILNNEILNFWKKWGLGFHTSIDGCPQAHDCHRHFPDGKGSSELLARNLPNILSLRPRTTGRATVLPDTVQYLSQSFEYLLNLGYQSIALVPGEYHMWDQSSVDKLENQFRAIMIRTIELYRQGKYIDVKYFDEGCKCLAKGGVSLASTPGCGAGRGMVLVDINGDVWPCHRWNKQCLSDWKFCSIFGRTFNYEARNTFCESFVQRKSLCQNCIANFICQGGCPAENLEDTGQIWRQHPTGCEIMKKIAGLVKQFHNILLLEKNSTFLKRYYEGRNSN